MEYENEKVIELDLTHYYKSQIITSIIFTIFWNAFTFLFLFLILNSFDLGAFLFILIFLVCGLYLLFIAMPQTILKGNVKTKIVDNIIYFTNIFGKVEENYLVNYDYYYVADRNYIVIFKGSTRCNLFPYEKSSLSYFKEFKEYLEEQNLLHHCSSEAELTKLLKE